MNVLTVMTLAYSIIDKETNRELHRVVLQNMPKHTFSTLSAISITCAALCCALKLHSIIQDQRIIYMPHRLKTSYYQSTSISPG